MKIAHVINPFKCAEDNPSYLYYAQPITFKSMHTSQLNAKELDIDVKLYTINYPEDDEIVPDYFIKLPHLKRSTQSEYPEISKNKKLPFVQDILDEVYINSDADYIVFTNSDICVHKYFYREIFKIITEKNPDFFIINRRDNIPKFKDGKRLTEDDLDYIYTQKGNQHPGFDCFIMKSELVKKVNMKNMFTGYPPWGYTLRDRLVRNSKVGMVFTDKFLTFHLGCDKVWEKGKSALWNQNIRNSG